VKEYSPFTPGVPVPLEFFVGRQKEVEEIVNAVGKAVSHKSVERIFVSGERGIGKSSLCNMALTVAEERHRVLGLHVFLGGVTTLEELARRVFERLLQKSRDKSWFETIKSYLGNHVKQVGLFGITLEFTASDSELKRSLEDFPSVLRNLLDKLKDEKRGLMLILDDINGLSASRPFADWLKSFVDEVATSGQPLPLLLMLVGLSERRSQLINHQPSLDRVFDLIEVKRFQEEEIREFYSKTFSKVNVVVQDEAMNVLSIFSGGYPVFIHEIGDAVFKIDTDNVIDKADASMGIFKAAQTIGAKYIEPKVLATIRSERYKGILKKIVQHPSDRTFTIRELSKRVTEEERKVLHNFLQKMKKLNVIVQLPGASKGEYSFVSDLYVVFFWLLGAKAEEGGKKKTSSHHPSQAD